MMTEEIFSKQTDIETNIMDWVSDWSIESLFEEVVVDMRAEEYNSYFKSLLWLHTFISSKAERIISVKSVGAIDLFFISLIWTEAYL